MSKHIFEIMCNAEGCKLAYASPVSGDVGYRIAGPKGWGGVKSMASIEIGDADLARYVIEYAPGALRKIADHLKSGEEPSK